MKRCPIAAVSPHIFRAKVAFTTATYGVWAVSCHEKSRPLRSRVPAASKYAGEIVSPYGSSTELFSVNSVVPGGKIGIPRSPPVKGTLLTVPAAVTPGMLRTASSIAMFFSSGTSPSSLRPNSTSIAPCGWNPNGAFSMRSIPRNATNEEVTRRVQIAICAPNNRSRKDSRRGVVESTGPLFIACNGLLCHTCRAGIIPNSSPLTRVKIKAAR